MKTYTFTHLENGHEYTLTGEQIKVMAIILNDNGEVLADTLTGYNCDTYADAAEELALEYEGNTEEANEYDPETYQRVRAYHRLLNAIYANDEECEKRWVEDFQETAEKMKCHL